ncbi:acetate--CoA ligase family protein [Amycolatopsis endophytica]|uniref:Acyl-CoA synthetase (NDP forming) n=1 Tax=Amycolatopsis endophytica TaxID=860233 RepID=A0A853B7X8_9PSEU|nr:acetate--CoA ligase [Amycolatopsis endophytica]NYI91413.1 acyl-CoA synthetase (NDP forming) [Amycolatopsis endophytica]
MTRSLRELFRPASIALVGATDKSGWSLSTFDNLRNHLFAGKVYLVNPRTEVVHGEPAHRSLSAIGEPVDLVYVMVPTTAVLSVLREGAELGIRNYVVLTAGFGETGPAGKRLEDEVVAFATEHGLTVLGPNGNGYINAAGSTTPYGLPIPAPLLSGPVGVVLQSGALASSVLAFAQARNVGLSLLTSMGNEAMVSVTDVMSYLVDDPDTSVIALFLESVRHPEEFARVCRRAARAGKPVVALKIGTSALASNTAQAHTGALVGDDRVIDAAFRRLGVVRVHSLEDLIITAGLFAEVRRVGGPRLGVVTPSGGASEIIADRAEQEGLELPAFAPETVDRLEAIVPDFATVQNPLDVTGYVVVDRTLLGRALEVVADDPGIDAVLLLNDLPRVTPADPSVTLTVAGATAERIRRARVPVVVVSNVLADITEFGRYVQGQTGFPYVAGGIEHGMTAIGNVVRWSANVVTEPPGSLSPLPVAAVPGEVWAEHRAARFLAGHGIPVVPAEQAADEAEAVAAAGRFGYPVVLKAAAEGLGHKSDLGGVRLDLTGPDDVRAAHREVIGALSAHGITGAATLVQPQRRGGVELLVGVVRDPAWGLTLAVGLGGVWVEVLRDSALRLLPVTPDDVRGALAELRGHGLLTGARGTRPADLRRLSEVIASIGDLALRLGPGLAALEVNPLLVNGPEVEALDALITWSWGHHRRRGPSKGRGGWWVVVEETRGMGAGPE